MHGSPNIARIGALCGDPARAAMLNALMGGKALAAGELARVAGISQPTASSHLAQLVEAGLLTVRSQGRHRYFTLGSDAVAELLESMMGLVVAPEVARMVGPREQALRHARRCYNHLAGERGVQVFESMLSRDQLRRVDGQLLLSEAGEFLLTELGIEVEALRRARAPMCRECLDWSERQSHLSGSVGRALLQRFETLGWLRSEPETRVLKISPKGRIQLDQLFPEVVSP